MDFRISSPCPISWEKLRGNDRVRFCEKCKLNVFNLAILSEREAQDLVERTERKLCVRLYDRGDQTATAEDCRLGRARKRMKVAVTIAALLVFSAVFRAIGHQGIPDRNTLPPIVKKIVNWIDPEPQYVMGVPAPPPVPSALGTKATPVPSTQR